MDKCKSKIGASLQDEANNWKRMDIEREICYILEEMGEEKLKNEKAKLLQEKEIRQLTDFLRHNEKKLFRLEQQLCRLQGPRDSVDNLADHNLVKVSVKLNKS